MSAETERKKSHVTLWLLGLAVAPLIYLLSVPPVAYSVIFGPNGPPSNPVVATLVYGYHAPYQWLQMNSPLKEPLYVYGMWWIERIERSKARKAFGGKGP